MAHLSLPRIKHITLNTLASEARYVPDSGKSKSGIALVRLDSIPITVSIQPHRSHLPALAAVDTIETVINEHGVVIRATAPTTPGASALTLIHKHAFGGTSQWRNRERRVRMNVKRTQETLMYTLSEAFPSESVRTLRMRVAPMSRRSVFVGRHKEICLTKAWIGLHAAFPALEVVGTYTSMFTHLFDTNASMQESGSPPAWPSIKRMHLEYDGLEEGQCLEHVTTMMTERFASASRLQRLNFNFASRMQPDDASPYLARLCRTTEIFTYTVSREGSLGYTEEN